MNEISFVDLRKKLAECVNKVAYGGDRIIITRHGKEAAAIVSIGDLWALQEFDKLEDKAQLTLASERLAKYEAGKEKTVPMEKVLKDCGMEVATLKSGKKTLRSIKPPANAGRKGRVKS